MPAKDSSFLLDCSLGAPGKNETDRWVEGAGVVAKEACKPRSASRMMFDDEDLEVVVGIFEQLHADRQPILERLILVLQPQFRPYFSRAETKAHLLGPRIEVRKGPTIQIVGPAVFCCQNDQLFLAIDRIVCPFRRFAHLDQMLPKYDYSALEHRRRHDDDVAVLIWTMHFCCVVASGR
jgi:hypothetical protein